MARKARRRAPFLRGRAGGIPADPVLFTLVFEISCRSSSRRSGYTGQKLALATFLTSITFPYLVLITGVIILGNLNSLAKFTAAAFARHC